MNCLFITAGGRKVRTFQLVGCSDQCPPTPQPPFPPKGGRGANYQSISDVVVQDFGFIFVVFTQKCIVDDICDGGREGGRGGARFFHFPPAGSTNKRVGKVCLTFLPN